MTLYEFKLLNQNEQADVLWEKGVMIADRQDESNTYLLYQLEGFYVEVIYHMSSNIIKGLKSFASTDQPLYPYLITISLDDLNS
jgi:hypothetical protein